MTHPKYMDRSAKSLIVKGIAEDLGTSEVEDEEPAVLLLTEEAGQSETEW